jgi:hypothetical protein
MNRRVLLAGLSAALAFTQLSCAISGGLTPMRESMSVARASLRPEYRVFYDAMVDYGDWVLIEPYGFVFRPRVSFDSWRPYGDGFWVPTALYGWVWVSAEPFGWATYHYGQWFYDPFQGWVWLPGLEWGPAWVAWQATDAYVGWAPLMPSRASQQGVPGGAFSYVPTKDLASTNLKGRIVSEAQLGARAADARPVENVSNQNGVTINRGPSLEWFERQAGRLNLAKIEDLVPATPIAATAAAGDRVQPGAAAPEPTGRTPDPIVVVQRAGERAAREARIMSQRGGTQPSRLSLVRPFGVPGPPPQVKPVPDSKPRRVPDKSKSAAPDSTR